MNLRRCEPEETLALVEQHTESPYLKATLTLYGEERGYAGSLAGFKHFLALLEAAHGPDR